MPSPPDLIREQVIREAAMGYVRRCAERAGGVVNRAELEAFAVEGTPLKLIDHSRGIRNPRELAATISILYSPNGPYDDEVDTADGLLQYAYRSGSTDGDNHKLREAYRLGLPVIMLRKIADGVFVPVFPVYVVDDRPDERYFVVAVDESLRLIGRAEQLDDTQRRYAERLTRLRLHQPVFRARVIRAYDRACAMCRLRHTALLDAAHIRPDGHPLGRPVVPNGLSLCKIHHAAFDQHILGVRPDLRVAVRSDVLAEIDGPMLRHGLQEMAGVALHVPTTRGERPDPEAVAERYELFRTAG